MATATLLFSLFCLFFFFSPITSLPKCADLAATPSKIKPQMGACIINCNADGNNCKKVLGAHLNKFKYELETTCFADWVKFDDKVYKEYICANDNYKPIQLRQLQKFNEQRSKHFFSNVEFEFGSDELSPKDNKGWTTFDSQPSWFVEFPSDVSKINTAVQQNKFGANHHYPQPPEYARLPGLCQNTEYNHFQQRFKRGDKSKKWTGGRKAPSKPKEVKVAKPKKLRQRLAASKLPDGHYEFVVLQKEPSYMRYFNTDQAHHNCGHTSLLDQDEKALTKGTPNVECDETKSQNLQLVLYAGSFDVKSNKIIEWSNDSGHFAPHQKYSDVFAAYWGWTKIRFKTKMKSMKLFVPSPPSVKHKPRIFYKEPPNFIDVNMKYMAYFIALLSMVCLTSLCFGCIFGSIIGYYFSKKRNIVTDTLKLYD